TGLPCTVSVARLILVASKVGEERMVSSTRPLLLRLTGLELCIEAMRPTMFGVAVTEPFGLMRNRALVPGGSLPSLAKPPVQNCGLGSYRPVAGLIPLPGSGVPGLKKPAGMRSGTSNSTRRWWVVDSCDGPNPA